METSSESVMITGVTGFIGAHVAFAFLKHGFKVRGTVRSLKNQAKLDPLRKSFGDLFNLMELVEADLTNAQSLIEACNGMNIVVHTASPVVAESDQTEANTIVPAVEGTKAIIEGCKKYGVRRLVYTSSIAAIIMSKVPKLYYDENDWSDESVSNIYDKSKTRSEKLCWEAHKTGLEVAVINPPITFGPTLNSGQFEIGEGIKMLMFGEMPQLPMGMMMGDVRDCAEAHVQAAIRPEANGRRFVTGKECVKFSDLSVALKEQYGNNGYPDISTHEEDGCLLNCFLCCCACTHMAKIVSLARHKGIEIDNTPSKTILGIRYSRPMSQTVIECVESLIACGVIKDQRKDKTAPMFPVTDV